MNLRTRKWGCALGITLLIAVPVALAVSIGSALTGPASAQDTLRAIPLFPGASQVVYTRPDNFIAPGPVDDFARKVYLVQDPPNDVSDYYTGILPSRGWTSPAGMPWRYSKSQTYVSGLRLNEHAPWVHIHEGVITNHVVVQAGRVERNGVQLTEVTLELAMYVNPDHRYIP